MTQERAVIDLKLQGVQELIQLTNQQFRFWSDALAADTSEKIRPGDLMDYWFILSALAEHPPHFRANKKEAFSSIPNLKPETVRKYVAEAGRLGFVETVKNEGERVPAAHVGGPKCRGKHPGAVDCWLLRHTPKTFQPLIVNRRGR